MGSVKDLKIISPPETDKPGIGQFVFSDRYSVFDWGEMPNHIKNKGASLCITGAYFFEKIESLGIKTHYRGVIEDGISKKLSELNKPTNIMEINLLRVIKPEVKGNSYDYSVYSKERINFLIPLEIIYRNYLPESSSVFKRFRNGTLKPEDIGLDSPPQPDEKLEKPVLDVSTKLESTDRYLKWDEAQKLVKLTDDELNQIKEITLKVNEIITNETDKIGLINEDGKIELGFNENRNLILLDVLGTPDECRFKFDGIPVSKEALRIYYRQTDWFKEVEQAKLQDKVDWKSLVKSSPPLLPPEIEELISMVYQSFCNEITGRKWFDTPALKEVLSKLKDVLVV